MKKTFHILLALVFMVLTAGVSVNKHYSGGELFSMSLFGEPESCCEMPCDCCEDSSEIYQITDDYIFSSGNFLTNESAVNDLFLTDASKDSQDPELNGDFFKGNRKDIHPPRRLNDYLSLIQSYLL